MQALFTLQGSDSPGPGADAMSRATSQQITVHPNQNKF